MKTPTHPWRTDKPDSERVVEVWYLTDVVLAVWTGAWWRRADDHMILYDVTHWREREQ